MKVALLGNQARAMVNFWSVLLRCLVSGGHEVLCLVPRPAPGEDPLWEQTLCAMGARILHYPLDRKGLNPCKDLATLAGLRRILAKERPDRLFSYTIKAVIYGSLAAALARRPDKSQRHAMITGLGYMFESDKPFKRLLTLVARLLYRLALARCASVSFQNDDDRKLFEQLSILPPAINVHLVRGTGVDTARFAFAKTPEGPPLFLFIGRLIEAKGLREFIQAAGLVRARHPEARFQVLGPAEPGPGAVPLDEVLAASAEGRIDYLGETSDVRPYLAAARAVVLPSWREGAPCALQEAMSAGRAVIAADAPGSREVVIHGQNGLLVPVRDAKALALAVEELIISPETARRMGEKGRAMAESVFDAELAARVLLKLMDVPLIAPSLPTMKAEL